MFEARKNNHNWLIWLSVFVVFCAAVYVLRSVLLPFVAGIIIGYVLDPIADKFQKMGMSRTWATVIVMLLLVLIFFPLLFLLLGVIQGQISDFIAALPD